ncbi:MAG: hypothetical protein R2752_17505 [Vicinamibacterales bacterium]
MADTKSHHADPLAGLPVQSDDVSFSGIGWFVVILTATTLFCMALVAGMFSIMEHRVASTDPAASPVARPVGTPPPAPNLLTDEPGNLKAFREREDEILTTYGWVDRNAGTVRIPVERAKALLLERGLPTR